MEIKKGIAVSPGIAIAKCLVIDSEDYRIPRREISPSQRMAETQRVRNAFKSALDELGELQTAQAALEQQNIKDTLARIVRMMDGEDIMAAPVLSTSPVALTAEEAGPGGVIHPEDTPLVDEGHAPVTPKP